MSAASLDWMAHGSSYCTLASVQNEISINLSGFPSEVPLNDKLHREEGPLYSGVAAAPGLFEDAVS